MMDPENRTDSEIEAPPEAAAERGAFVAPRCPNCGWQDVRPSRVKGVLDAVCNLVSMRPFRCRSCGHRFRRFRRSEAEE